MPQPADRPAGRYGTPPARPRPGLVAALVVVAAAFLSWVVWAALGAAAPDADADVTAFRVVSDREIEVRVTAAAGSRGTFACSVRALDGTREVVGVGTATLDAEGTAERWLSVRTRERAVTATIGSCSGGDGR